MRIYFLLLLALFCRLEADSIVYHGSPFYFEQVIPKPSTRIQGDTINWQGTAIFATQDRRIALFYTHAQAPGFQCGIDLLQPVTPSVPVTYLLFGGRNLEEALQALFGPIALTDSAYGFIYSLDGAYFHSEPGLGSMELVAYDVKANIKRDKVHRRHEIERYKSQGLINLDWKPDFLLR